MIQFIDEQWTSYEDLKRNKEKKQHQIHSLYATGLNEGINGVEYTFMPTLKIKSLENEIKALYEQIKVEDNETELCNEIFYTTKIEGANTTYKRTVELHNGKPVDHNNYFSEMMVLGGFQATKFLNVHGNKIDKYILRQMWEILTTDACDNIDIAGTLYRTGNVGVGNHMGLNPELIEEAMDEWISFYQSPEMDEYPFIKASLLHFSFEFIHPFCDGNGRAGRLLMLNYLINQGYDKFKAISISKEIAQNPNGYYNAFVLSDNSYTDCTPFLEYMLNVLANTLYRIIEKEKTPEIERE